MSMAMPSRLEKVAALGLCAWAATCAGTVAPIQTGQNLAALVEASQHRRDAQVREIRSLRRYTLHNERWKSDATMDVVMTWDGHSRKQFEIVSSNVEGYQRRVLLKIVQGEVESAAVDDRDTAVTGENYAIEPIGPGSVNGRPCDMVTLVPKRRNKLLLEGNACIDPRDTAVVMMQGRTPKSLSFWVGRADVKHEFRKIGEFWVPSFNRSSAPVKLIGTTELTIQFLDYSIIPKAGSVLTACSTHPCSPLLTKAAIMRSSL
jgi:hypothetical protein